MTFKLTEKDIAAIEAFVNGYLMDGGNSNDATTVSKLRQIGLDISRKKWALKSSMEPASTIIKKLGGEAIVAQVVGAVITAPYRWQNPKSAGGTNGVIPSKHIQTLVEYAVSQGIELGVSEFFPNVGKRQIAALRELESREAAR